MRKNSHTETSRRTARDFGRSFRFSARWLISIFPPSSRRQLASAFAMACDPPRGIGQPTACPAIPRTKPNADEAIASKGRNECAAIPPNSAWAGSCLKRIFASELAGQSAGIPNRASARGCLGKCNIGCRNSLASFSQLHASGFIRRR